MSNASKPSASEEEFFAREEVEKLRKLHAETHATQSAAEQAAQQKLHFMHCPKCGSKLAEVTFRAVSVDRCFNCHGVWLDAGELETLAGQEPRAMQSVVDFFFKK